VPRENSKIKKDLTTEKKMGINQINKTSWYFKSSFFVYFLYKKRAFFLGNFSLTIKNN